MLEKIRHKPIIITLSVIVFAMMLAIIIPRSASEDPELARTEPAERVEKPITKPSLFSVLPHKTSDYTIEYDPLTSRIFISVYTKPHATYYQQALNFIRQYHPDLSTLNIKSAYFTLY